MPDADFGYYLSRTCTRKKQMTEKEARYAAWVMMQEQGGLLEAYRCNYCGFFHIGHPKKEIVLARLRKGNQ